MAGRSTLNFLKTEAGAGALLALSAAAAILAANSPLSSDYFQLLREPIPVRVGDLALTMDFAHWVKDGLMAIFFFVVGLEIKFEILRGELSSPRRLALPIIAALGGMLAPALVYLAVNLGPGGRPEAWAIPTPTDVAFALTALALFAPRLPPSLRIFLLTLAIADDLGAIVIIAVLFTHGPRLEPLAAAVAVLAGLALLGRWRRAPVSLYVIGSMALWLFILRSGVSTSLAGVAAAATIPIGSRRPGAESFLRIALARLHPWVAYLILPLFAFTSAGFSFASLDRAQMVAPLTIGVALGLLLGKPIGVFGSSLLAVTTRLGRRPTGATWTQLLGVAMLCGAGFTMSLFIGALALPASDPFAGAQVRLSILVGSLASVLAGGLLLAMVGQPRD